MKNKKKIISVFAVILSIAQIIAGAVAVSRLPDTVPTHFNAEWVCDGVGSRWILMILAGLPLVFSLFALIALFRPSKQNNIAAILLLPMLFFPVLAFWMGYPTFQSGAGIGDKVNPERLAFFLPLMLSALLVLIGNYMPLIQPNKLMGIRLPSTLKNPQCWRLTHRFAGRNLFVTGLLLCIVVLTAFFLHQSDAAWITWVFITAIACNMAAIIAYARTHRNDAG